MCDIIPRFSFQFPQAFSVSQTSDNTDFVSSYHYPRLEKILFFRLSTVFIILFSPPSDKDSDAYSFVGDLKTDVIKIQHPPRTTVTIDYSVVCRKRKMFAEKKNGIKSQCGMGRKRDTEGIVP